MSTNNMTLISSFVIYLFFFLFPVSPLKDVILCAHSTAFFIIFHDLTVKIPNDTHSWYLILNSLHLLLQTYRTTVPVTGLCVTGNGVGLESS